MGCWYSARSINIDNQSTYGLKVKIEQDTREGRMTEISRAAEIGAGGITAGITNTKGGFKSDFDRSEDGTTMEPVPAKRNMPIRIPARGAYCRLFVQAGKEWEKFDNIRKWLNNGDTWVITDDIIHMLIYAFDFENKTAYDVSVLNDDQEDLAVVVKEGMETIRIPGKGCYCSIKVEPKDEWEKYESHRVYMKNRVKFTFDETMVILVQGSFVLHNYSKHRIKIYVKHDKEESPEIYSIKQEGEDCWDYGNATSALHMNLVKEVDSGKKERFVIPGEGIFCILYVYTLSGEWKPFYDVPRQINNNGILKVSDKMVKEVLANINKKRVIPDGNYLFVGNPGVGKSTLASSLSGKTLFPSGTSGDGSGVTATLSSYTICDGVTIMDTPGLSDQDKRELAAEAIEDALSNGGFYRIFFVITQESGRIRPDDLATIQIVLDGVQDITSYGIIINKISPKMVEKIKKDDQSFTKWKMGITENIAGAAPPNIMFNVRSLELEDAEHTEFEDSEVDENGHHYFTYTMADDLFKFITNTVVGFERDKKEVKLDLKNYEELQQLMGEKIQEFQKIIDNMTSTQAKDIERLQKENEMRVRQMQEDAALEARKLREAKELAAKEAQNAIEEAERKANEANKQYELEMEELREKERLAKEKAAAGLMEKDSQWQKELETLKLQYQEKQRRSDEERKKLIREKKQQEKEMQAALEKQQRELKAKLVEEKQKNQRGILASVKEAGVTFKKYITGDDNNASEEKTAYPQEKSKGTEVLGSSTSQSKRTAIQRNRHPGVTEKGRSRVNNRGRMSNNRTEPKYSAKIREDDEKVGALGDQWGNLVDGTERPKNQKSKREGGRLSEDYAKARAAN